MRILAGNPLINQSAEPTGSAGGVWSLRLLRSVATSEARAALVMDENPENEIHLGPRRPPTPETGRRRIGDFNRFGVEDGEGRSR